jgi:hypothetical protein
MKALSVFVFFAFIVCVNNLSGQFSTPIVPADTAKYIHECNLLKNAGVSIRKDYKYKVIDGKVTSEEHIDRVVKFSEDGRLQEFVYVDEQGRKQAIVTFDYYTNGLPKAEGQYHPTGELLKHTNYKYSYEGYLEGKSTIDQYGYVLTQEYYSIDENENTIIEKKYSSPQLVSERNKWVYSDLKNGKPLQHEKYNGESILMYKRNFLYEGDQLIREVYYNPAGNKAFYLEYTYDDNKNVLQIEKVRLDGRRFKNTDFKYNAQGILVGKIEYNATGGFLTYYKYTYE